MLKKMMIVVTLVGGFMALDTAEADARIVRRIAPVRRVAARAVYPVARRVVVARPVIAAPIVVARRNGRSTGPVGQVKITDDNQHDVTGVDCVM